MPRPAGVRRRGTAGARSSSPPRRQRRRSLDCLVDFGPPVPIAALAFSPDGKLLAAGGYQEVLLWDLANAKLAKRLGVGQLGDTVCAVAFRNDGRCWPWPTARPYARGREDLRSSDGPGGGHVSRSPGRDCLAFSPDGKFLAGGGADTLVHVWNVDDKETRGRHQRPRRSAAWPSAPTASCWPPPAPTRRPAVWEVGTWKLLGTHGTDRAGPRRRLQPRRSLAGLGRRRPRRIGPSASAAATTRRKSASLDHGPRPALGYRLGRPGQPHLRRLQRQDGEGLRSATADRWPTSAGTTIGSTAWRSAPTEPKLAPASADGTVKLWNAADGRLLATFVQISPRTESG